MRRRRPGEDGSATLELTILAPALLVLLGLVIAAGRIEVAASAVEQAAAVAARDASAARTAAAARAAAASTAQASLRDQGLHCGGLDIQVDTAGYVAAVGQPAAVDVRVSCVVALSDLAVPGMPGTRTLQGHMTSPLDRYRSR